MDHGSRQSYYIIIYFAKHVHNETEKKGKYGL